MRDLESLGCLNKQGNAEVMAADKALKAELEGLEAFEAFSRPLVRGMGEGVELQIFQLDTESQQANAFQLRKIRERLARLRGLERELGDLARFGFPGFYGCFFRQRKFMNLVMGDKMVSRVFLLVEEIGEGRIDGTWKPPREAIRISLGIFQIYKALKAAGYVFPDFRPTDFMLAKTGRVVLRADKRLYRAEGLLPAELAARVASAAPEERLFYHPELLRSSLAEPRGAAPAADERSELWNLAMVVASMLFVRFAAVFESAKCPAQLVDRACVAAFVREVQQAYQEEEAARLVNFFKKSLAFGPLESLDSALDELYLTEKDNLPL